MESDFRSRCAQSDVSKLSIECQVCNSASCCASDGCFHQNCPDEKRSISGVGGDYGADSSKCCDSPFCSLPSSVLVLLSSFLRSRLPYEDKLDVVSMKPIIMGDQSTLKPSETSSKSSSFIESQNKSGPPSSSSDVKKGNNMQQKANSTYKWYLANVRTIGSVITGASILNGLRAVLVDLLWYERRNVIAGCLLDTWNSLNLPVFRSVNNEFIAPDLGNSVDSIDFKPFESILKIANIPPSLFSIDFEELENVAIFIGKEMLRTGVLLHLSGDESKRSSNMRRISVVDSEPVFVVDSSSVFYQFTTEYSMFRNTVNEAAFLSSSRFSLDHRTNSIGINNSLRVDVPGTQSAESAVQETLALWRSIVQRSFLPILTSSSLPPPTKPVHEFLRYLIGVKNAANSVPPSLPPLLISNMSLFTQQEVFDIIEIAVKNSDVSLAKFIRLLARAESDIMVFLRSQLSYSLSANQSPNSSASYIPDSLQGHNTYSKSQTIQKYLQLLPSPLRGVFFPTSGTAPESSLSGGSSSAAIRGKQSIDSFVPNSLESNYLFGSFFFWNISYHVSTNMGIVRYPQLDGLPTLVRDIRAASLALVKVIEYARILLFRQRKFHRGNSNVSSAAANTTSTTNSSPGNVGSPPLKGAMGGEPIIPQIDSASLSADETLELRFLLHYPLLLSPSQAPRLSQLLRKLSTKLCDRWVHLLDQLNVLRHTLHEVLMKMANISLSTRPLFRRKSFSYAPIAVSKEKQEETGQKETDAASLGASARQAFRMNPSDYSLLSLFKQFVTYASKQQRHGSNRHSCLSGNVNEGGLKDDTSRTIRIRNIQEILQARSTETVLKSWILNPPSHMQAFLHSGSLDSMLLLSRYSQQQQRSASFSLSTSNNLTLGSIVRGVGAWSYIHSFPLIPASSSSAMAPSASKGGLEAVSNSQSVAMEDEMGTDMDTDLFEFEEDLEGLSVDVKPYRNGGSEVDKDSGVQTDSNSMDSKCLSSSRNRHSFSSSSSFSFGDRSKMFYDKDFDGASELPAGFPSKCCLNRSCTHHHTHQAFKKLSSPPTHTQEEAESQSTRGRKKIRSGPPSDMETDIGGGHFSTLQTMSSVPYSSLLIISEDSSDEEEEEDDDEYDDDDDEDEFFQWKRHSSSVGNIRDLSIESGSSLSSRSSLNTSRSNTSSLASVLPIAPNSLSREGSAASMAFSDSSRETEVKSTIYHPLADLDTEPTVISSLPSVAATSTISVGSSQPPSSEKTSKTLKSGKSRRSRKSTSTTSRSGTEQEMENFPLRLSGDADTLNPFSSQGSFSLGASSSLSNSSPGQSTVPFASSLVASGRNGSDSSAGHIVIRRNMRDNTPYLGSLTSDVSCLPLSLLTGSSQGALPPTSAPSMWSILLSMEVAYWRESLLRFTIFEKAHSLRQLGAFLRELCSEDRPLSENAAPQCTGSESPSVLENGGEKEKEELRADTDSALLDLNPSPSSTSPPLRISLILPVDPARAEKLVADAEARAQWDASTSSAKIIDDISALFLAGGYIPREPETAKPAAVPGTRSRSYSSESSVGASTKSHSSAYQGVLERIENQLEEVDFLVSGSGPPKEREKFPENVVHHTRFSVSSTGSSLPSTSRTSALEEELDAPTINQGISTPSVQGTALVDSRGPLDQESVVAEDSEKESTSHPSKNRESSFFLYSAILPGQDPSTDLDASAPATNAGNTMRFELVSDYFNGSNSLKQSTFPSIERRSSTISGSSFGSAHSKDTSEYQASSLGNRSNQNSPVFKKGQTDSHLYSQVRSPNSNDSPSTSSANSTPINSNIPGETSYRGFVMRRAISSGRVPFVSPVVMNRKDLVFLNPPASSAHDAPPTAGSIPIDGSDTPADERFTFYRPFNPNIIPPASILSSWLSGHRRDIPAGTYTVAPAFQPSGDAGVQGGLPLNALQTFFLQLQRSYKGHKFSATPAHICGDAEDEEPGKLDRDVVSGGSRSRSRSKSRQVSGPKCNLYVPDLSENAVSGVNYSANGSFNASSSRNQLSSFIKEVPLSNIADLLTSTQQQLLTSSFSMFEVEIAPSFISPQAISGGPEKPASAAIRQDPSSLHSAPINISDDGVFGSPSSLFGSFHGLSSMGAAKDGGSVPATSTGAKSAEENVAEELIDTGVMKSLISSVISDPSHVPQGPDAADTASEISRVLQLTPILVPASAMAAELLQTGVVLSPVPSEMLVSLPDPVGSVSNSAGGSPSRRPSNEEASARARELESLFLGYHERRVRMPDANTTDFLICTQVTILLKYPDPSLSAAPVIQPLGSSALRGSVPSANLKENKESASSTRRAPSSTLPPLISHPHAALVLATASDASSVDSATANAIMNGSSFSSGKPIPDSLSPLFSGPKAPLSTHFNSVHRSFGRLFDAALKSVAQAQFSTPVSPLKSAYFGGLKLGVPPSPGPAALIADANGSALVPHGQSSALFARSPGKPLPILSAKSPTSSINGSPLSDSPQSGSNRFLKWFQIGRSTKMPLPTPSSITPSGVSANHSIKNVSGTSYSLEKSPSVTDDNETANPFFFDAVNAGKPTSSAITFNKRPHQRPLMTSKEGSYERKGDAVNNSYDIPSFGSFSVNISNLSGGTANGRRRTSMSSGINDLSSQSVYSEASRNSGFSRRSGRSTNSSSSTISIASFNNYRPRVATSGSSVISSISGGSNTPHRSSRPRNSRRRTESSIISDDIANKSYLATLSPNSTFSQAENDAAVVAGESSLTTTENMEDPGSDLDVDDDDTEFDFHPSCSQSNADNSALLEELEQDPLYFSQVPIALEESSHPLSMNTNLDLVIDSAVPPRSEPGSAPPSITEKDASVPAIDKSLLLSSPLQKLRKLNLSLKSSSGEARLSDTSTKEQQLLWSPLSPYSIVPSSRPKSSSASTAQSQNSAGKGGIIPAPSRNSDGLSGEEKTPLKTLDAVFADAQLFVARPEPQAQRSHPGVKIRPPGAGLSLINLSQLQSLGQNLLSLEVPASFPVSSHARTHQSLHSASSSQRSAPHSSLPATPRLRALPKIPLPPPSVFDVSFSSSASGSLKSSFLLSRTRARPYMATFLASTSQSPFPLPASSSASRHPSVMATPPPLPVSTASTVPEVPSNTYSKDSTIVEDKQQQTFRPVRFPDPLSPQPRVIDTVLDSEEVHAPDTTKSQNIRRSIDPHVQDSLKHSVSEVSQSIISETQLSEPDHDATQLVEGTLPFKEEEKPSLRSEAVDSLVLTKELNSTNKILSDDTSLPPPESMPVSGESYDSGSSIMSALDISACSPRVASVNSSASPEPENKSFRQDLEGNPPVLSDGDTELNATPVVDTSNSHLKNSLESDLKNSIEFNEQVPHRLTFSPSLADFEPLKVLGRGGYGTVVAVRRVHKWGDLQSRLLRYFFSVWSDILLLSQLLKEEKFSKLALSDRAASKVTDNMVNEEKKEDGVFPRLLRILLFLSSESRLLLQLLRHLPAIPAPADLNCIYAMKTLEKSSLLQKSNRKSQARALCERNILTLTFGHPFLTSLRASFQSQRALFMVIEYCGGGDLYSHLGAFGPVRHFPRLVLYAAELVLALGHLHGCGVAYRDLKPENVLLDAEGHLRITDFGLSKLDTHLSSPDVGSGIAQMYNAMNSGESANGAKGDDGTVTLQSILDRQEVRERQLIDSSSPSLPSQLTASTAAMPTTISASPPSVNKPAKDRVPSFCGTEQYMAPEVLLHAAIMSNHAKALEEHRQQLQDPEAELPLPQHYVLDLARANPNEFLETADYWSLGVLIAEIVLGTHPFQGGSHVNTLRNIISPDVTPRSFSSLPPIVADFLNGLLCRNPHQRLGSRQRGGLKALLAHPFFCLPVNYPLKKDLPANFPADVNPYSRFYQEGGAPRSNNGLPPGFRGFLAHASHHYVPIHWDYVLEKKYAPLFVPFTSNIGASVQPASASAAATAPTVIQSNGAAPAAAPGLERSDFTNFDPTFTNEPLEPFLMAREESLSKCLSYLVTGISEAAVLAGSVAARRLQEMRLGAAEVAAALNNEHELVLAEVESLFGHNAPTPLSNNSSSRLLPPVDVGALAAAADGVLSHDDFLHGSAGDCKKNIPEIISERLSKCSSTSRSSRLASSSSLFSAFSSFSYAPPAAVQGLSFDINDATGAQGQHPRRYRSSVDLIRKRIEGSQRPSTRSYRSETQDTSFSVYSVESSVLDSESEGNIPIESIPAISELSDVSVAPEKPHETTSDGVLSSSSTESADVGFKSQGDLEEYEASNISDEEFHEEQLLENGFQSGYQHLSSNYSDGGSYDPRSSHSFSSTLSSSLPPGEVAKIRTRARQDTSISVNSTGFSNSSGLSSTSHFGDTGKTDKDLEYERRIKEFMDSRNLKKLSSASSSPALSSQNKPDADKSHQQTLQQQQFVARPLNAVQVSPQPMNQFIYNNINPQQQLAPMPLFLPNAAITGRPMNMEIQYASEYNSQLSPLPGCPSSTSVPVASGQTPVVSSLSPPPTIVTKGNIALPFALKSVSPSIHPSTISSPKFSLTVTSTPPTMVKSSASVTASPLVQTKGGGQLPWTLNKPK